MLSMAAIFVGVLALAQGKSARLNVSMDRTPDTNVCAWLKCVADLEDGRSGIKSIIGLKIYNLTLTNRSIKLASVSVFDPSPHLEPAVSNVFNVTGTVSLNHGDLMLGLLDESDCLYGSFLCELNLLNSSGQPALMTEKITPEAGNLGVTSDTLPFHVYQLLICTGAVPYKDCILLSRMAARLEAHSADVAKDMGSLEAKFDNLLSHLLTLEQLRNESYETPQMDRCYKGMSATVARLKILLWNNVEALCDTHTDGGGWIIFQRRTKGDVNFYRNWDHYKKGFGNIDTDYWLGNDVISNLTSRGYNKLRVDVKKDLRTYFAHYSKFNVADETLKYQLTVSGYDGTAGDSLSSHDSQFFSTYDRDNDKAQGNCAVSYSGAWWYRSCHNSNLNGLFGVHNGSGAVWYETTKKTSADFTEMKIRQG